MDQGAAPTLVIMLGTLSPDSRPLCGQSEPYEVICPAQLDPVTTRGEARAISALAAERGWTTVVTVTSRYHLRRAVYLDRRCSGMDVIGSGPASSRHGLERWTHEAKETIALPLAWISSC